MNRRADTDPTSIAPVPSVRSTLSRTLGRLAGSASEIDGLRERDLAAGDWILVRTLNSLYVLGVAGDGRYQVSGGWFEKHASSPTFVRVNGCTWGGHAILTGMVAAPGMFLEFENGVRTTRIQELRLLRVPLGTLH